MTINTQIRPYNAATDLTRILDIWFAASLKGHPFIGRDKLAEQRQLIRDVYMPQAESWVLCREDEVVGFISLLGNNVGGLFVDPRCHGMGFGRRLINHAVDLRGELSLEVYLANEQACGFYHSLGFREVSRRDTDDLGYPFPNATLHLKKTNAASELIE